MCGSGRIICREFNEETNGSHLKLSQVKNRKLQQESSLGEGDAGQGVKGVTGEGGPGTGLKDLAKERHYAPAYRTTISQTMNTLAK